MPGSQQLSLQLGRSPNRCARLIERTVLRENENDREVIDSMGRVEGKVAIVTGGAAGIGRAACMMLAREGAKVAVVDITDRPGEQVVSEIAAIRRYCRLLARRRA